LDIKFQNGVRLIGYDLEAIRETPDADEDQPRAFRLTLFWKLEAPLNASDLAASVVFVDLANEDGVSTGVTTPLPESHIFDWIRPGAERVLETSHYITAPPSMPSGKVHFEVGLLGPVRETGAARGNRIGVVNDQGHVAADHVDLD
jgi:hypothetical protein